MYSVRKGADYANVSLWRGRQRVESPDGDEMFLSARW